MELDETEMCFEMVNQEKRLLEMADLIAFNKADGENLQKAKIARRDYRNALHMFPPKPSGWTATATICSGLSGMGIEDIWANLEQYIQQTTQNDFFIKNRQQQSQYWLHETIKSHLHRMFYQNKQVKDKLSDVENQIKNGQLSPFQGAEELLRLIK